MTDRDALWIEVDLDALAHNYRQAQALAGGRQLLPVVKADAYGHGAVMVAKACQEAGARYLAVATAHEALALRRAGIDASLLVLGVVPLGCVEELTAQNVALSAPNLDTAGAYLSATGMRPLPLHLKVDTGMNRLGFSLRDGGGELLEAATSPLFQIQGLFTHFADSGNPAHDTFTRRQHEEFQRAVELLARQGVHPPMIHCMNSDATVRFPGFGGNYVRPGLFLYGYGASSPLSPRLRPVASIRARIGQVKWVEPGQTVSYGLTWTATRPTCVATVPVGYADGLPRSGSGKLQMLLRGRRVPQIGLVCMDMCMLDLTDVPEAQAGDVVTVVGEDSGQTLGMDELATACGTIPYEPLALMSSRAPRYYLRGGAVCAVARRVMELKEQT